MFAPLRFNSKLSWIPGIGFHKTEKKRCMVRNPGPLIPYRITANSSFDIQKRERGPREINENTIDTGQSQSGMIHMGCDRTVHLNQTVEERIPLFSMWSRGRGVRGKGPGIPMNSLSLHETDLLGPFRNQIQVTHQDHGVLGGVLDTFLSGCLNPSDESRGHMGGKADIVNKESRNTSLFGVL